GPSSSAPRAAEAAPPPTAPARPGALLLVLALLLLALVHPPSWPGVPAPLWFPSAGLGLALIAWFGPRAAGLLLLASLLAGVRAGLWPAPLPAAEWPALLGRAAPQGAVPVAVLAAAWVGYRRADGAEALRDPDSAILFLLVPGAVLAAFALLRTLPVWLASSAAFPLLREAGAYWVGQSLGLLALAPPLLVWAVGS